jgi:hypothetical protein
MKLAKREKLFIGAAACILGIFLIFNQLLFPFFDRKDYLKKHAKELEKSIKDLNIAGITERDIDKTSGGMGNSLTEPIYTFINKATVAIGLESKTNLNPSTGKELDGYIEDKCSVDLTAVTLPQLTDFLYRIEKHEKNIYINSFTFTQNKKEEGYLDASIKVVSYKKVNPG